MENGTDIDQATQISPLDMSEAIKSARRGFRRDTQGIVDGLDLGALFLPLSKPVDDAPVGEFVQADDVTLSPHLVETDNGDAFVVAFTRDDALSEFGDELSWTTTDEGDLQYCSLPVRIVFDLAVQLIEQGECNALIVNPSSDDELLLQRHELEALRQGQPTPLVGYVAMIPFGEDEKTLVSELSEPPSAEFVTAVERCISALKDVKGYRLEQTFNRERDLEPHPTLTLLVSDEDDIDTAALERALGSELGDTMPAPGYVDVVFERV